ncbi:MAG TPA: DUF349 domain-containing protein [Vicinamibacterales bacterium]|nr:DUF349 domain-containing protein [Vicinamibacterales bacterium]
MLRALAREDAEARVRRAAVARLEDVGTLGEIARTDPDPDVRTEAARQLTGLGAETRDPVKASEVARQLIDGARFKEVVVMVRESSHAEVRAAVVDLIDDPKSLGSISRHARDAATRARALARLQDPEELLAVSLKAEHTDVAVAALERVGDTDGLSAIAQRGRNKVAARRARVRLRQIEEAVTPVAEAPAAQMSAEDQARAAQLLRDAEALVALPDPSEAEASLSRVRLAWAELGADTEIDAALAERFDSASEAVREAIAERQLERAAEQIRAEAAAREQADRLRVVEEIEQLEGAGAEDRIAELKVRWDALPPIPQEYAASLTRRFQDACRAFEERERRRMLAQAAAGRLHTLAAELEQLVASDVTPQELVARWRGLRRDAEVLREHAEANPEAADRLERAIAVIEEKEQQQVEVRQRQEQDNLRRLHQICRQVETLAAAEQITLKAGDRALGEIRSALEGRLPLPTKKDRQEVQTRLEAVRAILGPRVQELRDADEWQRWANLQVQEELAKKMEALAEEPDLEVAARRMRELQGRWKQVALAPRTQGEALWRRFKTAQDAVFGRTSAHLAAQNEERGHNLAKKQSLCEQAEALAASTDWVKTATALQALQAEWKNVGPVSRGSEKAIWERFRAACDQFFSRRHQDLKKRKDEWSENLARKEALCARAEALTSSTDWEAAAAECKQLQVEWKQIGPVRRSKSDAVWQRFRTACDAFFDRYKHRDQVDLQSKAAARADVIRELEALVAAAGADGAAPDGLADTVVQARARWQQAPELPRTVQQELAASYYQALGKLVAAWPAAFAGTDLDPETTRKRMEKLLAKVESLTRSAVEAPAPVSPAELLAQRLRERLAANTMAGGQAVAHAEENRWREAEQEVRSAQSQWTRLGPLPADVAGPLNERFQRACRKFYDQRRK